MDLAYIVTVLCCNTRTEAMSDLQGNHNTELLATMKEFFFDYGLFLAKSTTVVAAIVTVLIVITILASRDRFDKKDRLKIKKLNKRYDDMAIAMNANLLNKTQFKNYLKATQKNQKAKNKQDSEQAKTRIFVLDFQGDIRASAVAALKEEINAILTVATENDEVFLRLESAGGVVHGYGLAASQLMRLRSRNIKLTVSVDKVAASGGYMMACVGNHVVAAPFAIIGSIGVIAQIPNFNKVLKKHDVEFEQFTAGEFKRTVTMFGENTPESKTKFREEIEDIHLLFKDFIVKHRPDVDIKLVSTGESWPGTRALERKLVDEIVTSDDYLMTKSKDNDIYEIKFLAKKNFGYWVSTTLQHILERFHLHHQ